MQIMTSPRGCLWWKAFLRFIQNQENAQASNTSDAEKAFVEI